MHNITPIILTYNEAPNIGRTLDKLAWAKCVIVVDSYSSDNTLAIIARHSGVRVRVFQRKFDNHADQWNFALKETGITTEWILALDADYLLTDALVDELRTLEPQSGINGYSAQFVYCVRGRPIRGSLYPPVTVLYRRQRAYYRQDGHTQRVVIDGVTKNLEHKIMHDDRKELSRWISSQNNYMKLEARKLMQSKWRDLNWPDRLRRIYFITPVLIGLYCLIIKGAILDGRAGIYYTFQRVFAEALLSLYLMQYSMIQYER